VRELPSGVVIRVDAQPETGMLHALMLASWGEPSRADFAAIWSRSLAHVCAFVGDRLIGYLNVAWDGAVHAPVFDTTVHPDYRRRGVGMALVKRAVTTARDRGAAWLHVDFEPRYALFCRACGFGPTDAGLIRLR
jgi:GNAT superfamily N-acetyltransferase